MPFVIRFHTCNLGSEVQPDPLTGVPVPVAVDRGLTAAEKRAVRDRLAADGAVGPDGLGRFRVHFPDGRAAEAEFPNLPGDGRCVSGTLTAGEPTPELIRLAFDLAVAGNLLLVPDGLPRPLAPSEAQRQAVMRRWLTAVTVPTAHHLWALVAPPPPEPITEAGQGTEVPTDPEPSGGDDRVADSSEQEAK